MTNKDSKNDEAKKDRELLAAHLNKKDAAEYLRIKESDVLQHVRRGKLKPVNPRASEWRFTVEQLDGVAQEFDKNAKARRWIAVFTAIGGILLLAGAISRLDLWEEMWSTFPQICYCAGSGLLGVALRAHRLERESLSSPWPDYAVSYPFIVLVNSAAILATFRFFAPTQTTSGFLLGAFPVGVILGLYAHPDHWIIPQLLRRR